MYTRIYSVARTVQVSRNHSSRRLKSRSVLKSKKYEVNPLVGFSQSANIEHCKLPFLPPSISPCFSFLPVFVLCSPFASFLCPCAYSSRPGHGQRQRQWGRGSPGSDHWSRGGACGRTWGQATQVPRRMTPLDSRSSAHSVSDCLWKFEKWVVAFMFQ